MILQRLCQHQPAVLKLHPMRASIYSHAAAAHQCSSRAAAAPTSKVPPKQPACSGPVTCYSLRRFQHLVLLAYTVAVPTCCLQSAVFQKKF
jgi:hypothetical protein